MKKAVVVLGILLVIAFLAVLRSGIPWTQEPKIGGGDIIYPDVKQPPVTFSHKIHAKDRGVACKECHTAIWPYKKGQVQFKMKDMEDGKFCGTCHNGKKSFGVKDSKSCAKCHVKK